MFNYFTATLSLFQLINLSFMFVECLIPWILVWTLRFKVLLLNRREALCIQKVYSLFGCPCVAFPNRESATHEAHSRCGIAKVVPQSAWSYLMMNNVTMANHMCPKVL